jgi:hypothetical protein
MTKTFVTNQLGEHHVIIWKHVWDHLSLDRKQQLSVDYYTLTGRPFPVPLVDPQGVFDVNSEAASYHPMNAVRLLDTRVSNGIAGKIPANTVKTFMVAGRNGIPAEATSVTGNITVINPSGPWALYLGPDTTNPPTTSNINFNKGDTLGNGTTVALGDSGTLNVIYMGANGNLTDVTFDVTGYFVPNPTS